MKFRPCGLALLAIPPAALAHVFAQPYTLPVPFSVYAYAASAALLLSFVVVGLFPVSPAGGRLGSGERTTAHDGSVAPFRPWSAGGLLSVLLLALSVATGWFGTQNAFANFNMTFFWIGFVLGLPYAVAVLGDFYAPVNPWRTLAGWLEHCTGLSFAGRIRYPAARLGYAPALLLYMTFIWLELFGELRPRGLSTALAVYTVLNVAGAFAFGHAAWFKYGEFFGVFFRLIGMMSPRVPAAARAGRTGRRRWRAPFVGLLEAAPEHMTLVLFILFMLSSTAFDGLHSTLPWVTLYWKHLYPAIAAGLDPASGRQYVWSTKIYYVWQWLSLAISPLIYLAVFGGFVHLTKKISGSRRSTRELVLQFALTLVPIAFVYHLTHYYTVLLSQGGQIAKLASDPFGFGWNLFGTARWVIQPVMLDVGHIWMTQVMLILAGHIVSVYLAHVEALRVFSSLRPALLSQLPMLALMVMFTNFGLWILSLPLAGG